MLTRVRWSKLLYRKPQATIAVRPYVSYSFALSKAQSLADPLSLSRVESALLQRKLELTSILSQAAEGDEAAIETAHTYLYLSHLRLREGKYLSGDYRAVIDGMTRQYLLDGLFRKPTKIILKRGNFSGSQLAFPSFLLERNAREQAERWIAQGLWLAEQYEKDTLLSPTRLHLASANEDALRVTKSLWCIQLDPAILQWLNGALFVCLWSDRPAFMLGWYRGLQMWWQSQYVMWEKVFQKAGMGKTSFHFFHQVARFIDRKTWYEEEVTASITDSAWAEQWFWQLTHQIYHNVFLNNSKIN